MTMLHLAQLNIGRIRYSLDDPRMADFVNNLDRVNAIAEHTPGFVWRLQDDSGNAIASAEIFDPSAKTFSATDKSWKTVGS